MLLYVASTSSDSQEALWDQGLFAAKTQAWIRDLHCDQLSLAGHELRVKSGILLTCLMVSILIFVLSAQATVVPNVQAKSVRQA